MPLALSAAHTDERERESAMEMVMAKQGEEVLEWPGENVEG